MGLISETALIPLILTIILLLLKGNTYYNKIAIFDFNPKTKQLWKVKVTTLRF